jgi:hypothetical protein
MDDDEDYFEDEIHTNDSMKQEIYKCNIMLEQVVNPKLRNTVDAARLDPTSILFGL